MTKYNYLHDKIRLVRRSLGLKQKDFIVKISESLKRDVALTPGLVSQWEAKRATPKEDQIAAIAKLTKNDWWTMLWFMHDDIDANQNVTYLGDGTIVIIEDDDNSHMGVDLDHKSEEIPEAHIVAWREDPKEIHKLRGMLHGYHSSSHPAGSSKSTATDFQQEAPPMQGGLAAVPPLRHPEEARGERPQPQRRPTTYVGDLVTLETTGKKWAQESPPLDRDVVIERQLKIGKFNNALQYFLEVLGDPNDPSPEINKRFSAGPIRAKATVCLKGVLVHINMISSYTPASFLGMAIGDHMGELLLIDRIQTRSSKKMILFATHESRLDLSQLEEYFQEHIKSADALGFKVVFACGVDQAARKIAELSVNFNDPA